MTNYINVSMVVLEEQVHPYFKRMKDLGGKQDSGRVAFVRKQASLDLQLINTVLKLTINNITGLNLRTYLIVRSIDGKLLIKFSCKLIR